MAAAESNGNPTYLVLGATGGIGTELCEKLADSGARLVLAGRSEEKLADLAEGKDATTVTIDATRFEDVEKAVKTALDWSGRLDGVANVVGSILLKPAHLVTPDDYDEVMAVNARTAFGAIRAAAAAMRKTGGSVVLMASCAARAGLPNHEGIAAAKGAVIGLAQSAAATYASSGIRVNAVAPGLVKTPLTEPITSNETSMQASVAMHPLGRVGEPGEVADVIAWLLGPQSSWVTGQVIGVDGGVSTLRGKARA
jgi:NAD(P)-dependent dehydrogenase (short-subunit alcohol dehydrogenase family)